MVAGSADRDPSIVVVHANESGRLKEALHISGERFNDVETLRIFRVKDGKIVHIQHMVNNAEVIEKVKKKKKKKPIIFESSNNLTCSQFC